MPKENIEAAVRRGHEGKSGSDHEVVMYEGFGPGNVAVIVQALTDKRSRTAPVLWHVFSKHGGALGTSGSVSFMFQRQGCVTLPLVLGQSGDDGSGGGAQPEPGGGGLSEDSVMEAAIEAGAEDVEFDWEAGTAQVYCEPTELAAVRDALQQAVCAAADSPAATATECLIADLVYRPMTFADVYLPLSASSSCPNGVSEESWGGGRGSGSQAGSGSCHVDSDGSEGSLGGSDLEGVVVVEGLSRLLAALEEEEDVQAVYHNARPS